MYVCLDARLASAWTKRRILFVFGIQESVQNESVYSSSKSMGPTIQNRDFLENRYSYSTIYEDHIAKWKHVSGIFRKITARLLGAQMRSVSFFEIGFTGLTDLIIVRYSATTRAIISVVSKTFKVSCIWESMCYVFVPIFQICFSSLQHSLVN
jgi:hypothetical protein